MLVRNSDLPTCPLPALPARGQQPGLCPGPLCLGQLCTAFLPEGQGHSQTSQGSEGWCLVC